MLRRLPIALLLALILPPPAEAQPRLMAGGGFTAPTGDVGDAADPGYHLAAGLDVTIPQLPVGFRADGRLHVMGASSASVADTKILGGSLSVVFRLPGVGLQPYVLGGIGTYRVEAGPAGAAIKETNRGYHGGFGVAIGALGLGAFAEIRYVQIDADTSTRMIPLTIGLRL